MRRILLLALVCTLSACSTFGRPITQAQLGQIVPGVTTEADLVKSLGSPLLVVEDSYEKEIMSWGYRRSGFAGIGFKVQSLVVTFDTKGKVQDFMMTEKTEPTGSR